MWIVPGQNPKKAGHKGLVIIVDELETILRTRSDVRGKSLNGLRQIIDGAKDFPGILWLFSGTREFFDSKKGVRGLEPLHDRIKFTSSGGFVSPKQPQLELQPFDKPRLKAVALKLEEQSFVDGEALSDTDDNGGGGYEVEPLEC